MYSRAVIALAVAAAAAPALSAPLAARDVPTDTDSGALNLSTIGKAVNIGNDVISGFNTVKNFFEGNNQNKREFEELLARAAADDASGAIDFKSILNIGGDILKGINGISGLFSGGSDDQQQQQQRRELVELLARAAQDDASGAIDFKSIFNIGGDIIKGINGISSLFSSGSDQQQQQQRRELEELFARAATDDASGALNLGVVKDAVSIGNDVITGIQNIKSLFTGSRRAEFEELLARELPTDESGAINFGSIVKIGSSIIQGISGLFGGDDNNNQKRDFSPVAREVHDLLVRQQDESGASILTDIVKVGGSLLSSFFGGSDNNNNQRDTTTPTTTAPPATGTTAPVQISLPTDASGAIDFKSILSTVGSVVSTVAPFFLKREEMELLARQAATPSSSAPASLPTDASGAIDFKKILSDVGSVVTTVAPFFLKREELELLARQAATPSGSAPASLPTDASGAIDFKKILSDVGSVVTTVAPFFLKREELELLARQTANLPTDASGAIDFKSILSDVGSVVSTVAPFFLKREEELLAREALATNFKFSPGTFKGFPRPIAVARSLNELD